MAHHSPCACCCRCARPAPTFVVILVLAGIASIWVAGLHDRGIVQRAIQASTDLESAGHFGAAIETVDGAKKELWFFGAPALEKRAVALRSRAARPKVWPHAD